METPRRPVLEWERDTLRYCMPSLLAIVSFVIGVLVGTLLTYSDKYQERKKVFGVIAFLLALNIVLIQLGYVDKSVHISTISFSMGVMNTAIRQVGTQLVNITFVTGTLNRIARHIALGIKHVPLPDTLGPWDTHWRRAAMLARVWCAFFLGSTLSGITTPRFDGWALLLPILSLLLLIVFNPNTELET